MSYVPLEDFPPLPGETWDALKKRHARAMAGKVAPRLRRRGFRVPDRTGYHPGLARFPNDPRANVESEAQLRRVVDARKRETGGGEVLTPAQLWDAARKEQSALEDDMKRDLLVESLQETLHGPEVPSHVDLDDYFDTGEAE